MQLERGLLFLDFQANDMEHIFKTLVEKWISIGLLENKQKNKVLDVLLKNRNFVDEESMAREFLALGKNLRGSSTKPLQRKKSSAAGIGSAMMFSAMTTTGAAKIGEHSALPPSFLKDIYPIMECLPDDAEGYK